MRRHLLERLREDLNRKILLISGPRQTGKTTLARMLGESFAYLSWDVADHRKVIRDKAWDRSRDYVVFDELHKMRGWKRWLKGVFDTEGTRPGLVVTGSARLDAYKRMGDSLAGRFFAFRLHPFDVRELNRVQAEGTPQSQLERILDVSGFPEPFLELEESFYGRWSASHLDIILRQDLIDAEAVRDIPSIELLIDLIAERVGSPISYQSLAQDLQVSDKTAKRWLTLLEDMYVVFAVRPFHRNIARARLKQPKYYLYDVARGRGDQGSKLENAVACSLLKECHFRLDCLGQKHALHYVAKRGGGEVDFVVTKDGAPIQLVEVKTSDPDPTKALRSLHKELAGVPAVQLVQNLAREATYPDGIEVREVANWLTAW